MAQSSSTKTIIVEVRPDVLRVGRAGDASPLFSVPHALDVYIRRSPSESDPYSSPRQLCLAMTQLMNSILLDKLHLKPRQCRVLVVEELFFSKYWRDLLLTVLLRELKVASVSFQPDVCMAALGCGQRSGMVVHVGRHESTGAIFACESLLVHTLSSASGGFESAYSSLRRRLEIDLSAASAARIGRQLGLSGSILPCRELPQGATLDAAAVVSEADCYGILDVLDSLYKRCPLDVRKEALQTVVILGECPLPEAIHQAIDQHLSLLAVGESTAKVHRTVLVAPADGDIAFLGASAFGSLSTAGKFVSLQDVDATKDLLVAPDWLSVHPQHWQFFGPSVSQPTSENQ